MNRKYFDGDYRRVPDQNLAGASKGFDTGQLINKCQFERKKREKERVILEKTLILQAAYRGYVCRKYWRRAFKTEFDFRIGDISKNMMVITMKELHYLLQRMYYIYPRGHIWNHRKMNISLQREEANNFVHLLHQVAHLREKVIKKMAVDKLWLWRIANTLVLNMRLIKYLPSGCNDIIPSVLETLIYYTDVSLYSRVLRNNESPQILTFIWTKLFQYDVFLCLVKVLGLRYKSPISAHNTVFGMQAQIFKNLIYLINTNNDIYFRRTALKKLANRIIKPPIGQDAVRFLLPVLRSIEGFPLCELGHVLKDDPYCTPESLFRILYLDNEQTAISFDNQKEYFLLLSKLMFQLLKLSPLDISGDDSSDENLEIYLHLNHQTALQDSIALLNSPSRSDLWIRYLDMLLKEKDAENLLIFCQCLLLLWIPQQKPIYVYRIIKMVAFHRGFLNELLQVIKAQHRINCFGSQSQSLPLLTLLSRGVILTETEAEKIIPSLTMFCFFFKHNLAILNDELFYKEEVNEGPEHVPFQLNEIKEITKLLKDVAVGVLSLAYPSSRPISEAIERIPFTNTKFNLLTWRTLLEQLVSVLRLIHNRDSRRQFTEAGFWLIDSSFFDSPKNSNHLKNLDRLVAFSSASVSETKRSMDTYEERYLATLRCLPFVIDFLKRFMLYQYLITELKGEYQNPGLHFLQSAYILTQIRRDYLYEDAFEKLNIDEVPEVRIHVKVHLISSLGVEEPGIDGGGLFREFIIELLKTAFDPNRGFFLMNKDNELYPNPKIEWIERHYKKHYFFIGRMLGKAMYENVLVEIPLAEFFLAKLLGAHFDQYLNGLSSLDPDVYRHLMSLMNYKGDFSDLGLDFTVSVDCYGSNQAVELKPNGSNIPVTQDNVLEYIHLVAEYKINAQIATQTNSFLQGLVTVIPQEWISLFSTKELQLIVSGNESPIDIADLRESAVYAGGYSETHPTIQKFWHVVSNFNSTQKSQLLKFVTSCSRPPLLGFKELYPPFCIQFVDNITSLPSASTCMNIFKLPNFQEEETMKEKILYAISSGSGFELI